MAKEEQPQQQQEDQKQQNKKELQQKQEASKKWKGKDWFSILSPKSFGGKVLAETPSTDPDSVVGRKIDVPASFLFDDKTKNYMKISFVVTDLNDKTANTAFGGFSCNREFIFRSIRKGSQKLDAIGEILTKDNWKLQVTVTAILNRNIESNIQVKTRKFIIDSLSDAAKLCTMDDFVRTVVTGAYQKKMRKDGSKIYPLRFAEISKIEVLKPGLAAEAEKNN